MHDPSARVPLPDEQGNGNPGEVVPFEGFDLPESNFWRLPNNWFDLAARFTSWAEHKVIEYILRHTWGYHEYGVVKLITMDEFMHGRKRRDGSRLDAGCGMAENSIKKGINDAVAHGFLIVHTDDSDRGRIKKYYAPRMRQPLQDEGDHALTLDQQTLTPQGQTLTPSQQQLTLQSAPLRLTPQALTPGGAAPDPRTEQDSPEIHPSQEVKRNNTGVVAFNRGGSANEARKPHQASTSSQALRLAHEQMARAAGESTPRRIARRTSLRALPSTSPNVPATAHMPATPVRHHHATGPAAARTGRGPAVELDPAQINLAERLIAEGVASGRARALVQQTPAERIERQLAWIDSRSYRDRAATLVAAIEGDFSMPPARSPAATGAHLSPDRDKFYRGQYALCPHCGSRPCAPTCDAAR